MWMPYRSNRSKSNHPIKMAAEPVILPQGRTRIPLNINIDNVGMSNFNGMEEGTCVNWTKANQMDIWTQCLLSQKMFQTSPIVGVPSVNVMLNQPNLHRCSQVTTSSWDAHSQSVFNVDAIEKSSKLKLNPNAPPFFPDYVRDILHNNHAIEMAPVVKNSTSSVPNDAPLFNSSLCSKDSSVELEKETVKNDQMGFVSFQSDLIRKCDNRTVINKVESPLNEFEMNKDRCIEMPNVAVSGDTKTSDSVKQNKMQEFESETIKFESVGELAVNVSAGESAKTVDCRDHLPCDDSLSYAGMAHRHPLPPKPLIVCKQLELPVPTNLKIKKYPKEKAVVNDKKAVISLPFRTTVGFGCHKKDRHKFLAELKEHYEPCKMFVGSPGGLSDSYLCAPTDGKSYGERNCEAEVEIGRIHCASDSSSQSRGRTVSGSSVASTDSLDIEFEDLVGCGTNELATDSKVMNRTVMQSIFGGTDSDSELDDFENDNWDLVGEGNEEVRLQDDTFWDLFCIPPVCSLRESNTSVGVADECDGSLEESENRKHQLEDINRRWNEEVEEVFPDSVPPQRTLQKLSVHFAFKPTIHQMVVWAHAYRLARRGSWEQYGRDRNRFKERIACTSAVIDPILMTDHRQKVRARIEADDI